MASKYFRAFAISLSQTIVPNSLTATSIMPNCFQRNCPCVNKKVIWLEVLAPAKEHRRRALSLFLLNLKVETLIILNSISISFQFQFKQQSYLEKKKKI